MNIILSLIIGLAVGYFFHSITMKIGFKQRTIENKIKVYDSIISHWVRMRNLVFGCLLYSPSRIDPRENTDFDRIYGESQTLMGEAILVCEDRELTDDIIAINERLYRTNWGEIDINEVNTNMENIRNDAMNVVSRMREDIRRSTRLEWSDLSHILGGLINRD
jgi:hypothetical protein